jgi:hypothetical protein
MPAELVKIVNANGQVGWVADTYPPLVAGALRRAPSGVDDPSVPATMPPLASEPESDEDQPPAKNATKAAWVTYAIDHGMEPDKAEGMTRDELIEEFTDTPDDTSDEALADEEN